MKKIHYVPYADRVNPMCGVYKSRQANVSSNKSEVTCKSCLRWNFDAATRTADIIDIFDVAKESAQ